MARKPSSPSTPGDPALGRALALVRDLRAPCPWDHAQTRHTLRPYLVEEALELDQALRRGEPAALRDEPGVLLLHLAFQIANVQERHGLDAEAGKRERLEDEVGDLLFAIVNLARKLAIDPRAALERANDKFQRRFETVEQLAEARGLELGRASLEELDELWEEVKRLLPSSTVRS